MQSKSIYAQGANDGLIMGICLVGMFFMQAYGMKIPALMLLGDLMMLAIPVIAFILLNKGYKASHFHNTFSAIWLHGIIFFFCGSLIMALAVYIYLRYIEPFFIVNLTHMVAEFYSQVGTPEADHIALVFDRIIEKHLLPTPITFSFTLVWLISFSGSMLSFIIALILKGKDRIKKINNLKER